MDNSHPPPPKKYDRATMIAEARRALTLPTTSAEDRQAALRYLLDNDVLTVAEVIEQLHRMFSPNGYDSQTIRKIMTVLCERHPAWLKVGVFVLDPTKSWHGVLRQVRDINSIYVTLSPVLGIGERPDGPEGRLVFRKRSLAETAQFGSDPIEIQWTGEMSYKLMEEPILLPESFAEMVRANESSSPVAFTSFPCKAVSDEPAAKHGASIKIRPVYERTYGVLVGTWFLSADPSPSLGGITSGIRPVDIAPKK